MSFTIKPLPGRGAGEISGLDCSVRLDPVAVSQLRRAFGDYPVLVIRDQRLTAQQFAAFTDALAPLERTSSDHTAVVVEQPLEREATSSQAVFARWSSVVDAQPGAGARKTAQPPVQEGGGETDSILYVHPDAPDVMILTNELHPDYTAAGIVDDAHTWHSDGSHKPEPSLGTALYALRNPSRGGDTEFCNMTAVYDALPAATRDALSGRMAIHHWSKARNPRIAPTLDAAARAEYERKAQGVPEVRHPAVRTHPATGKPSAFVSPRFTIALEGLDAAGSEALLDEIFRSMEDEGARYRHAWRDGDLVIWDNRCVNHRACGGYTSADVRTMLRVTLRGDRPYYRPA
jgi:taurine dioxygenase